jgi:hypothetical protein
MVEPHVGDERVRWSDFTLVMRAKYGCGGGRDVRVSRWQSTRKYGCDGSLMVASSGYTWDSL